MEIIKDELICIKDHTIEFKQGGYGIQIKLKAGEKYKVEFPPLYLNWNETRLRIPYNIFDTPAH